MTAPDEPSPLRPFVIVCAAVSSAWVMLLIAASLLLNDWTKGVAVHGAAPHHADIGLTAVYLTPAGSDKVHVPARVELRDLCLRKGTVEELLPKTMPMAYLTDTPAHVWCAFEDLGSLTTSLLTLSFFLAAFALTLTAMRALEQLSPPIKNAVEKIIAAGVSRSVLEKIAVSLWASLWFFLVLVLITYAAYAPAAVGLGVVNFGKAYGLIRAAVFFCGIGAATVACHLLKLWDEKGLLSFVTKLKKFAEIRGGTSPPMERAIFIGLIAELCTYCLVFLTQIDFALLACFVGLLYLTDRLPNYLLIFILITALSAPFDIERTAAMDPTHADPLDWIVFIAYLLILILKLALVACMLIVHTKVKCRLRFLEDTDGTKGQMLSDTDEATMC